MKRKNIKEPEKVELTESEIEDLKSKIMQDKLSQSEKELLVKMLQGFTWLSRMFGKYPHRNVKSHFGCLST
jgi:hypothetical protein